MVISGLSCERYNLVERLWQPMAELDCNRSSFTVACLEGFVYLFGGHTIGDNEANCTVSTDILIYDSGNDFWQKSEFRTPCVLLDAVAVGHAGLIYVAGGMNDNERPATKIMEFDPANGDWTRINTNGLPEDLFSGVNVPLLSLAAGGWRQDDEGFLLVCGKVGDCFMLYGYHFSLNRWRLSARLHELSSGSGPGGGGAGVESTNSRVIVLCQREFVGLVSVASASTVEQLRLPVPHSDSIDDQLMLFHKFQIKTDWSGEIDLPNHCLLKAFCARPGFQFLLAALVGD